MSRAADGIADRETEIKTYDITDTFCQICLIISCPITWIAICPGVLGVKILTLEEEEAVLTHDCCMYHSVANRPYGELGSVEKRNVCCCVGFTSNLSPRNPEGGGPTPIIPGDCCETALVNEIVHELKLRMKGRGGTGQIKRAEENLKEIKHLHAKIDAVMAHLQIPPVEAPMEMDR
ncbi:unnamed protein product [Pylaiella littoralis]